MMSIFNLSQINAREYLWKTYCKVENEYIFLNKYEDINWMTTYIVSWPIRIGPVWPQKNLEK